MSSFACPYNLIITGVGGQGNVLISQLLARALIRKGYRAVVGETYGVSQRGGSVMSHVRILEEGTIGPIIPAGRGDLVLGLEPMETLRILRDYGNPAIRVITNTRPISPVDVIAGNLAYPDLGALRQAMAALSDQVWMLDASALALEMGNSLLTNMIMVGALIGTEILPLTLPDIVDILEKHLDEKIVEANVRALWKGMERVRQNS